MILNISIREDYQFISISYEFSWKIGINVVALNGWCDHAHVCEA